ncbi:thioredoxin-disulfide reductase [Candidatus Woesearchaeota archaeon]|nr:thioredoxin-disulfide reductase [Candidatus Woesearchaeota archaeon]
MEDLIIIGGGPAGYTAAIYAARAHLNPLVFEGSQYGGQLMFTTEVENFPGFPKGIMGPELMSNMREQAERFGAKLISEDITKVELQSLQGHQKDKGKIIVFVGKKKYETKALIIATGAGYKKLGLENEKRLSGKGVSYCATCDGYFFKGKDIVIVGGGDAAMEEADFLTKFANSVKVIHRRDALAASKFMQDRAFANKKISFVWNSEVVDILGKDRVESVKIKNNKTNQVSDLTCQGIFVAIGHTPNTQLFENQLKMEKGYIITEANTTKTSVKGVFAAGDVQDWKYRQAITSAGTGCMAAIDVERYLAEMKH